MSDFICTAQTASGADLSKWDGSDPSNREKICGTAALLRLPTCSKGDTCEGKPSCVVKVYQDFVIPQACRCPSSSGSGLRCDEIPPTSTQSSSAASSSSLSESSKVELSTSSPTSAASSSTFTPDSSTASSSSDQATTSEIQTASGSSSDTSQDTSLTKSIHTSKFGASTTNSQTDQAHSSHSATLIQTSTSSNNTSFSAGSFSPSTAAPTSQTGVSAAAAASKHSAPVGAIVGGVIGGLLFLLLVIGLCFFLRRRKNRSQMPASAEFLSRGYGATTPNPAQHGPLAQAHGMDHDEEWSDAREPPEFDPYAYVVPPPEKASEHHGTPSPQGYAPTTGQYKWQ